MVNHKGVLAIVPARGGSKSIPKKNIKRLGGHPLLAYSVEAGRSSRHVDRVIVSTDDETIAEIARAYGAEVPFLRPEELAQDDTGDWPVFEHALRWHETKEGYLPDFVVQLRPTSPFRPPDLLDRAVELLKRRSDADCVRTVTPSGQNPYKMWRLENDAMTPLMSHEHEEPFNLPRQNLPNTYWQTGHVDVIRTSTILDKKSMTGETIVPLEVDPSYAVDIDRLDQWRMAESALTTWELPIVRPFPVAGHLPRLLVLDFDGVVTDNRVWVSEDGIEAVTCSRADGMGIELVRKRGIAVMVLSKEKNPVVEARCRKLGIRCIQGLDEKVDALKNVAREGGYALDEVAYIGNDVNDLTCMRIVNWRVAVADAHPALKAEANWILSRTGGHGAVREFCDALIEMYNQKELSDEERASM